MLSRSSALRTVTVLVIVALLLNTLAPVASAQDGGGNVYLPAVSGGQSASVGDPSPARTAAVLPHLGRGQHRRPVAEPGAHRSRHRRARRQLGTAARRRPAAGRPRPSPLQPGQHQCPDHARRCSPQPGRTTALRPRRLSRAGAYCRAAGGSRSAGRGRTARCPAQSGESPDQQPICLLWPQSPASIPMPTD